MGQDIRELLKQDNKLPSSYIRKGHESRFMERLEKELPKKKKKVAINWLHIAASIVVVLSVSVLTFNQFDKEGAYGKELVDGTVLNSKNATVVLPKQKSPLAAMHPDYGEAETYYLTTLKVNLSQITVDDTNRELVESFMKRLQNLDKEYQDLNQELIEVPNMQSVEAMIENLQFRLQLMKRLKSKLKELETIQNENYTDIQA